MTGPKTKSSNAPDLSPETFTAQALGNVEEITKALVPPVHVSATFERDADGGYSSGRGYSRPNNPAYDEPEALLATLEGGTDCLLFASGMAAANAVFQSLLPGDHVVAPRVMYWTLRKWLIESAMSWGLDVEFVDITNLDQLRAAMRPVCREQDAFWNRITAWRRDGGAVLGPFEAWLLLRGMRTLFVRVQHCSETALTIARHFHGHPKLSMAVSLCSSCPVMRRRTRLERNQCRLLFTQELRELAAR